MEENIKLIKPNNSFKNNYLDMISEWKEYGEELIPWSLNLDTDDFDSLVESLNGYSDGIGLPDGFVPCTTLWLVNNDNRVLGGDKMKKTMFLSVMILILTFFSAGCWAVKEPPDISISIDNKEIDYVSAKNKWDGTAYDREDTFVTIFKEQRDIPIFENGSIAEITFNSNPPAEFKIMDILIDENGKQIYTDKEIINIPVELIDGKCSFEIEKHLASSLSSYYEPGKKDIRGFRMIASWGENECEYAFVIKTYEIDRTEYLTGEIITDGDYEILSSGIGSICFVPDKESREIIEEKYDTYNLYYLNDESYFLYYDNISVTESLPNELGIYKVKVKFDLKEIYSFDRFNINDIELTDNIGTILYEGKEYETNNLDLDVKVKDRVCGLIVDSVNKLGDEGFRVTFCGEIETEGYYNISYSEMNASNYGTIYYDDKYESNVPMMMGESNNKQLFLFIDKEELFSQLEEHSSFGRGKFKISNFHIVYNVGMRREPTEVLTEIVSLDDAYKNMFEIIEKSETNIKGHNGIFAIVSNTAEYDENNYAKSYNYYYINKNNPKKVYLLTTEDYYFLDEVISDTEFSLITEGYNEATDSYGVLNRIKCKITDKGAELSYEYSAEEQEDTSQEQQLLLNGISLTKDIIRSVYRVYKGEEKYTYELLLYILAFNDDESNLYKGYFPFDEDRGAFIFPLDKSHEVLTQVFGAKEYSFENVFDYDEESDIYYKNLDFGWATAYRAENVTADISDDKSKLFTQFELINQWYDVEGDPVPTAIAECEITYSINKSNDKIYLQFENMEILSRLVD
ncbi:MAG: hypothetical protein PHU60_08300 [Tissierellia bacterium]|nr:hypothetical protein [Tissierellia bacterium]